MFPSSSDRLSLSLNPPEDTSPMSSRVSRTFLRRQGTSSEAMEQEDHRQIFHEHFWRSFADPTELTRSSMKKLFETRDSFSHLAHLVDYIHRRYPSIPLPRRHENCSVLPTIASLSLLDETKLSIHDLFNLFDPHLRSKAMPTRKRTGKSIPPLVKTPVTLKRFGTKLSVTNGLPQPSSTLRSISSIISSYSKQ